jgi:hypothetical protein
MAAVASSAALDWTGAVASVSPMNAVGSDQDLMFIALSLICLREVANVTGPERPRAASKTANASVNLRSVDEQARSGD